MIFFIKKTKPFGLVFYWCRRRDLLRFAFTPSPAKQSTGLFFYGLFKSNMLYNKKKWDKLTFLLWCRRRDLNPHMVAHTGFWVQRVCHFTTSAYIAINDIDFNIKYLLLQQICWKNRDSLIFIHLHLVVWC